MYAKYVGIASLPSSSNVSFIVLPFFPLSFDNNFKVVKVDTSGTGPEIYHVLLEIANEDEAMFYGGKLTGTRHDCSRMHEFYY